MRPGVLAEGCHLGGQVNGCVGFGEERFRTPWRARSDQPAHGAGFAPADRICDSELPGPRSSQRDGTRCRITYRVLVTDRRRSMSNKPKLKLSIKDQQGRREISLGGNGPLGHRSRRRCGSDSVGKALLETPRTHHRRIGNPVDRGSQKYQWNPPQRQAFDRKNQASIRLCHRHW